MPCKHSSAPGSTPDNCSQCRGAVPVKLALVDGAVVAGDEVIRSAEPTYGGNARSQRLSQRYAKRRK